MNNVCSCSKLNCKNTKLVLFLERWLKEKTTVMCPISASRKRTCTLKPEWEENVKKKKQQKKPPTLSDFGLFWRSCSRYRSERAVRTLLTESSMTAGSFLLDFNVIAPCALEKKNKLAHPMWPAQGPREAGHKALRERKQLIRNPGGVISVPLR